MVFSAEMSNWPFASDYQAIGPRCVGNAGKQQQEGMPMLPNSIEVITLFVDDIDAAKSFYEKVFASEVVYQDTVSAVLKFSGAMINLLETTRAPQLVEPSAVASPGSGSRVLFTIRVDDVDAVCAELGKAGVSLLNGPTDRPWGRRTAAFADPSGHVWEVAQELG
jgi:catechol 2,3-dioxygenase-like lactoylglutathione lyase family enzyme